MKKTTDYTIDSGYYLVRPKLDPKFHVDFQFQLSATNKEFCQFEFFYIAKKNSYVINHQSGLQTVKWNGETGVGNLEWTDQNIDDESMLWTLAKVNDQQFIIHNKSDPSMVWDVHNYYSRLAGAIKLEKEHDSGNIWREAQIFVLDVYR